MSRLSRWLGLALMALCAAVIASSCAASEGGEETDDGGACTVGAEGCPCTQGGACDPGLTCLSDLCVDTNAGTGGDGAGGGFSTGSGGDCQTGCSKLDVLFAVDHSGSMQEEIAALGATSAFSEVVSELAAVNCGNIGFRVGLTDDNDRGFIVPPGWSGASPWFDSDALDMGALATAFNQAAGQLLGGPETPTGCEHVLTSATNLLKNDSTGFVREDALLVLVLITDVDDYGAYDQGVVQCQVIGPQQGCTTPPPPLNMLHDDLLALKANDPKGLAAIIVAGDPSINAGVNICNQPASCCGQLDCDGAFHADRLWTFAAGLDGMNGYTSNICNGAGSVPTAVQDAFANNIDLACKGFDPPK